MYFRTLKLIEEANENELMRAYCVSIVGLENAGGGDIRLHLLRIVSNLAAAHV